MCVFELQNSIIENGCTCIKKNYICLHIELINLRSNPHGCYVIYYLSS